MDGSRRPYVDSCPVGCLSPLERTEILLEEGFLMRCPGCGHLVSQCTEEEYRRSMLEFDTPSGTTPGEKAARRARKRIGGFLADMAETLGSGPEKIRLLDVGCSSGTLLKVATEMGFAAEGVEPAPRAAEAARLSGLRVRIGTLEQAGYADGSFDALTLFEVIEHVRDPLSLLRECAKVLRPGGLLLVGTGNAASWTATLMGARWEYFRIAQHGGHISFFTPGSMRVLADRTGFRPVRIRTKNVRVFDKGTVPSFLYRAARLACEIIRPVTVLAGTGHDMFAVLRRAGE
ncbi:MAG: class I SAM-dependent methyltransferase [Desulfobacteraceae bacterium]|nr:class I SAM-dependent methyltransferase [Desulfobacteraceae bacterium]